MNFDVGADDQLDRRRIAVGFLCHAFDTLEHWPNTAEWNADWKPAVGLDCNPLHGRWRVSRHVNRWMRCLHRLGTDNGFRDAVILSVKFYRIGGPDLLEGLN